MPITQKPKSCPFGRMRSRWSVGYRSGGAMLVLLTINGCGLANPPPSGGDSIITLSNSPSVPTKSSIQAREGQWQLETIGGQSLREEEARLAPWIQLDEKTGKVQGFSGCNSFGGSYSMTGRELRFDNLLMTQRACPYAADVEQKFMRMLEDTTSFDIDDNRLQLYGASGVLGIFSRNGQ